METDPTDRVLVRLPRSVLQGVKERARANRRSVNAEIVKILEERLQHEAEEAGMEERRRFGSYGSGGAD